MKESFSCNTIRSNPIRAVSRITGSLSRRPLSRTLLSNIRLSRFLYSNTLYSNALYSNTLCSSILSDRSRYSNTRPCAMSLPG